MKPWFLGSHSLLARTPSPSFVDGSARRGCHLYPSLSAYFAAHARLLQSGVCTPAWRKYQADHDLAAYIQGIAARYATDPSYAAKIIQLAHGPHVSAALVEVRQRAVSSSVLDPS